MPGTTSVANGLGSQSVDPQVSTSKPASLSTILLPVTGDAGFSAVIDRFDVATGGSRHVTADFEWRVDVLEGSSDGLLDLFILRGDGAGGEAVHLQSNPDASATVLSFGQGFLPLEMPARGTWTHVHLELAWPDDGGLASATAKIGGAAPMTEQVSLPLPSSSFNLLIGSVRVNGNTPKVFHHVDDVIMRAL